PFNEVDRQAPRQERIFAIGFHAAAPARVAHQVDVRRPEREALVDAPLAAPEELVVLGAGLVGDRRGHAEDEAGIPGRGQPDGLREHRGAAGARHPVQALVPPVVGGNAEPLDGRRIVHRLRDLLRDGHAREQVVHALLQRRIGVQVKRGRLAPGKVSREQGSPKKSHAPLSPGSGGFIRDLSVPARHSWRNATTGSSSAARRAGRKLAADAASRRPITTAAYVAGSVAVTPYRSVARERVRTYPPATPAR